MDGGSGLDELGRRRALAARMGGEEAVARHRGRGKLTVRERIDQLCDPGSFREIGSVAGKAEYDEAGRLTGFSPSNFLFGRARIDGRPVVIAADDNTVRGGAADATIDEKVVQAEKMALELRLPMIRLIDATGGSVRTTEALGRTYVPMNPGWDSVVASLETVPVVALVLGSVAGIASARAVSAHLTVMVEGMSHMFIAGPPVVRGATGRDLGKDELGGARIHERAGAADLVVPDEESAFAAVRRFLGYLPSASGEEIPRAPCDDPADRREPALASVVPPDRRKVYRMREIMEAVFDAGSVMEMAPRYGRSSITALARLEGRAVGVLASDPMIYGGAWSADTAMKVTRFVDFAETFRLPVVHLVDIPGFRIGLDAEQAGTIRHGSRALAAVYQATVPWCSVIIRKCFGVAGAANMNPERFRFRYAWPSGDWGSLPLEGGVEAAFRRDLDAAPDRAARLKELTAGLEKYRDPFRTAEAFNIEEIVDPCETRPLLCEFAELAYRLNLREPPRTRARP
ncbi:acyl-CoA carboxylase subunit beta [Albimonas pacifica]|uniref:Propionyl-CoA carboxylase beta chain n=1 Tax=Albimonas pacifica TaxID=1114924 RepID=A0A1I3FBZ4_9RHOB|nr:carboxyl transferase domain-containing protein [Albimonas pacifica]SFI08735.1 propionyl-CoA carboxylase beta chain [Albimonas pacifica]